MSRRRRSSGTGPSLALALGLLAASPAPALVQVERPDDDVQLFAVALDRQLLAETLPAYGAGGSLLLPLGELCRLLEIGIEVDPVRGVAGGFVIDEARRFALDAGTLEIEIAGRRRPFDPSRLEWHHDDLYVDRGLLAEWLPLRLEVDPHTALLTVVAAETLPIQARLARQRRQAGAGFGDPAARAGYQPIEQPYQLLDGPFLDQTLRLGYQRDAPGGEAGTLEYSSYLTGDLLFMEASAFLAGTERDLSDARLSLSRRDPEGRLLGRLHARELSVGDVFHPGLELIALPSSGPGLLVSSFPLTRPELFDRQTLRGDLPPGWEVELYRGSELLAVARARADGRYEFLDVPLLFGLNEFRLELYGPQGQRRSERRIFHVGDSSTPKGEVYFRLAANDPGARLAGRQPAGERASLEISAGLARRLSTSISLAGLQSEGRRQLYGKLGLRGYWSALFANLDIASDRDGGMAMMATVKSRWGGVGLQLQYAELDDFASERFLAGEPLRRRSSLRVDAAVPAGWLARLPVVVELREDTLSGGRRLLELYGRVSASRRGLAVASELRWSKVSPAAGGSGADLAALELATGQLLVSRVARAFALRAELDYRLLPSWQASRLALTAEKRLAGDYFLTAGFSRGRDSRGARYQAGVSRLEGAFAFGLQADYSPATGLGATASLAISVGRDGRDGAWHHQGRSLAGSGGLSARAFLDDNGNGQLDGGELPLEGVGLVIDGAPDSRRSDPGGELFVANLPAHQPVDVALATSTLDDPYWRPSREGVRLLPRPGKVAVVDFPVQVHGEVTGTVYLSREGISRPAGGVEVQLVDERGSVAKRVRSAYDGFYALDDLKPGRYRLQLAAAQLDQLGASGPAPRDIVLSPAGTVLDGVDVLLRLGGAPEPRVRIASLP